MCPGVNERVDEQVEKAGHLAYTCAVATRRDATSNLETELDSSVRAANDLCYQLNFKLASGS